MHKPGLVTVRGIKSLFLMRRSELYLGIMLALSYQGLSSVLHILKEVLIDIQFQISTIIISLKVATLAEITMKNKK